MHILNMNIFLYRYVPNEYITNVPTAAKETLTRFTYNNERFRRFRKTAKNDF
jgi:hypothetical protein